MARFRTPELIPLIFIVIATAMLSGLGMWQIERLQWKNALIADITTAHAKPTLHAFSLEPYRRIEISGQWLPDKTMKVAGKPQFVEGQGYFRYTPLKLADGSILLVNRGWAPNDWSDPAPAQAHVTGILRPFRTKRLFTPENHPEHNLWLHEDQPAMEVYSGLTLKHLILEATGERKSETYPYPSDGKISLRNDHLGYAITWFSLAFIGIFMFVAYHRKP